MKKSLTLLLALVLLWAVSACGAESQDSTCAAPETIPVTAAQTEEQTQPLPETTARPAASVPEQTQVETTLHSGIREDGSFDDGTLFIGDSHTYGFVGTYLKGQGLLGDARYMAISGVTLGGFYQGSVMWDPSRHMYSGEYEGLYMCEAAKVDPHRTRAIYIMLGTNHGANSGPETYIRIVQELMENSPEATIYLQKVPYATSELVNPQRANEDVETVYAYFREQDIDRVMMIDTQSAIGYQLVGDGIHLNPEGRDLWYRALVAFATENQIPQ